MPEKDYRGAYRLEPKDLLAASKAGALPVVAFRESLVADVLSSLDRGRSVLLVGGAGAGKTAVVHALAHAMIARDKRGGLKQISSADFLANTHFLGDWQTKTRAWADLAMAANDVWYVIDAWNLPTTGHSDTNRESVVDSLRALLDDGRLRLVAEATPEQLRLLQRVPSFAKLFQVLEVAPLTAEQVDATLSSAAERQGFALDVASRESLVHVTSRFLPARPQPGPALALLEQVARDRRERQSSGDVERVSPAIVERVFCAYTGLPPFIVSRHVTMPAGEIRAWFSDRIVGQRAGIDAVIEMLALYKARLHDPSKPIGTLLFVGPTGVGKTEVARALATFLFGSPQRLLRFDLSEFKDYHSFELLLGSPRNPTSPARLLDPVRAQPFQVVLLDELEKAHGNVWDLLLPLLDEGRLTSPLGDTVDFRNTVIIATSNVGAREASRSLGFGARGDEGDSDHAERERIERERKTRDALEVQFRPEFLNRFQNVVVFHPLSLAELRKVARQEMARVLARDGIAKQGLVVDVDDDAVDLVLERGVDARYGARALKREVQRGLVLPLAMTLMENAVAPGSILKVVAHEGSIRIRTVDTAESRAYRATNAPARDGKQLLRWSDLAARVAAVFDALDAIEATSDEPSHAQRRADLAKLRQDPSFWRDPIVAQRVIEEHELSLALRSRLDGLFERTRDTNRDVKRGGRANDLARVAESVRTLENDVAEARRELVLMGEAGRFDALVEVRPIGGAARIARDLLVNTYRGWAASRKFECVWLRDPRSDDESAWFAVRGPFAFGLLRGEAGMHRVRIGGGDDSERPSRVEAVAVRVAAWTDVRAAIEVRREESVGGVAHYGTSLRTRLEFGDADAAFTVQNGLAAAECRDLAREIFAAWIASSRAPDNVVRRYDLDPPLVRDARTGIVSGRPDALAPHPFDALLRACTEAVDG